MSKITTDSNILGGKPTIKGTRISVDFILNLLESGMEISEILKEYPHLKKIDIKSAIAWARNSVEKEKVILFDPKAQSLGRLSFA